MGSKPVAYSTKETKITEQESLIFFLDLKIDRHILEWFVGFTDGEGSYFSL
jgi:hypothetical protein